MVASHLLRMVARASDGTTPPIHITLVNRANAGVNQQNQLARGLAYGTQSEQHLLNVPTGRMSAFADQPDDFLRFLALQNITADGGSFVARKHYGAYLRDVLDTSIRAKRACDQFTVRHDEVRALETGEDGKVAVQLGDQSSLFADRVVLALGNFAPANLFLPQREFFSSPRYVRDPWVSDALNHIAFEQPVLLIGTGLTMFDVALSLHARHRQSALQTPLKLIAISRHGLLPQAHRPHTNQPTFDHAPANMLALPATIRTYLRAVRAEVARAAPRGMDWRDVVASLRPITATLWQRLPTIERKRFLRHLRAYWDVHRHRAAPAVAKHIAQLADQGIIAAKASRILGFEEHNNHVAVTLHARGVSETTTINVGAVINCTGPSSDIRAEPLLAEMAARGQLSVDALGLGINISNDFRLLDAAGKPHAGIHYVGPLLKARDWEATAVPDLREYAKACADAVLQSVA